MSLRRAPLTIVLLATNILVYLVDFLTSLHGEAGPLTPLMAWGAIVPQAVQHGEYYRIFTAGFLHFSVMHIAVNMYALAISGMLCETLYGSTRFGVIYFVALIAGGVLAYETTIGTGTVTAGASGAIMGLFGAIAALGIKTPPLRRTLVNWALFPIIATLLVGFTTQGISNAGHIGGLIAGALAGFILPASRLRARAEMLQQ